MKCISLGKIFSWVLIVMMLVALVGCGSKSSDYVGETMKETDEITQDSEESSSNLPQNRKLIQKAYISVETENLDELLSNVENRVSELGGYIENSEIYNGSNYSNNRYRNADMIIRVPANSFDSFIDNVGKISNIISSQKTVDDVTLKYVATESRVNALKAEESRLIELMAQAENLSDLLTIEERLTEVRSELESVTSTLRVLENQVDYATIELTVDEVKEYTDNAGSDSIWKRIGKGFLKSIKNIGYFFKELFVFVVILSPYIFVVSVVVIAVVFVVRTRKRKKQKADIGDKKE